MMNKIILSFLLSVNIVIGFAQNSVSEVIRYEAPGFFFVLEDSNGKEINRAQEGKDVIIEYDVFLKNYRIKYKDSDGKLSMMKLDYKMEEGLIVTAIDSYGHPYRIVDLLKLKGTLLIFYPNKKEGYTMLFLIENAKKSI